jgi:site-specific DNA recombinase
VGQRAIGVVRVSQVAGREGDSFASPGEQADRIKAACERDGLELLDIVHELDVSGGLPIDKRPGLGPAVRAVEAGEADVIVGAYFDRLFRSLRAQADAVERVERAGGQVFAVDVGQVTSGSAGQWLSSTMLGTVSEYQRRTTAERTKEAQIRAVARGVAPFAAPPGYMRGRDGRFVESSQADVVAEAFGLRAGGASIAEVREFLLSRGVKRSHHGVSVLLKSRVVLGEIRFGKLINPAAHKAIVDVDTWEAAQRSRASSGRRAKSERLLARLDVLRCAGCDGAMTVQASDYRCPGRYRASGTDCSEQTTIKADLVEAVVVDAVKAALADVEGRASAEQTVRDAVNRLERAQAAYDAAMRVLDPLEPAAVARLGELRAARDSARGHVDRLGGRGAAVVVTAADWDALSFDARRALVRAVVARVVVAKGRGAGRVRVELVGE